MRAAIVIALVAVSRIAGADDRVAAERFYRGGEKAYRAQSFAAAAANFEQAYKAMALPEIAFSAAQAYRRQYRIDGDPNSVARAVVLYRAYLEKIHTGGRVADAADALAEMQHELDKLIKSGAKVSAELAAEHTQLGVNVVLGVDETRSVREIEDMPAATNAAQIKLTIDGKDVAAVSPINVAPGVPHAIHAEANGYFPADRTETVAQGDFRMIDLPLEPKPAILVVITEHGARISIDGRPAGIAPAKPNMEVGGLRPTAVPKMEVGGLRPTAVPKMEVGGLRPTAVPKMEVGGLRPTAVPKMEVGGLRPTAVIELVAGKHLLAILHDGREPFAREIAVTRGETTSILQPLTETARRRAVSKIATAGCITAGLAAVSTIVAVIEDTRASSLHNRIVAGDQPPSVGADYNSDLMWRDRFDDSIWAFGGLTVALGVTAAILYYTDQPSLDGVRVEPLASPTGGGAAISGAF